MIAAKTDASGHVLSERRVCDECGTPFFAYPAHKKKRCSEACSRAALRKAASVQRKQTAKPTAMSCPYCGTGFNRDAPGRKFCSDECAAKVTRLLRLLRKGSGQEPERRYDRLQDAPSPPISARSPADEGRSEDISTHLRTCSNGRFRTEWVALILEQFGTDGRYRNLALALLAVKDRYERVARPPDSGYAHGQSTARIA